MRVLQIRESLLAGMVEQMQALQNRISAGQAIDFASYKQQVGRIQGLKDAVDVVNDTFRALLNEEDDK